MSSSNLNLNCSFLMVYIYIYSMGGTRGAEVPEGQFFWMFSKALKSFFCDKGSWKKYWRTFTLHSGQPGSIVAKVWCCCEKGAVWTFVSINLRQNCSFLVKKQFAILQHLSILQWKANAFSTLERKASTWKGLKAIAVENYSFNVFVILYK